METKGAKPAADGHPVSDAYLVHRVGTQVGGGIAYSVGSAFRTAQEYGTFTHRYLKNPNEDFFNDRATVIYNSQKPVGKAFKRILLPPEYRKEGLTSQKIQSIRDQYAAGMGGRAASFYKLHAAINMASNFGALYLCSQEDVECNAGQVVTFLGTAAAGGIFYIGINLQGGGYKLVEEAGETEMPEARQVLRMDAYKRLTLARKTFTVMNVVEMITGSAKLGVEGYNLFVNPEQFNFSAAVDGGRNLGLGASWFFYNRFIADKAAEFASIPATLDKANDVLMVHATVIPRGILLGARVAGIIGPLFASAEGAADIYRGMTDEKLGEEIKEHKIVSGALGLSAQFCFLGFAFFMTPASIPVGTTFAVIGFFLLAAQTLYNDYDNVISFYGRRVAPHVSNPFPALYEAHLRTAQVAQASEQKK